MGARRVYVGSDTDIQREILHIHNILVSGKGSLQTSVQ